MKEEDMLFGALLPDPDFFKEPENEDSPIAKEEEPNKVYERLARIECRKCVKYPARKEEKEKREKFHLHTQSLDVQIYSVKSALLHLEPEEKFDGFRFVVNKLGEMLIAKDGEAGCDRIAHYSMSKLTLDNSNKIPDDYHIVGEKKDSVLSAGMLKIQEGKFCGLSVHSGGYKLPFESKGILIALAIILQEPDESLSKNFKLTEVDSEGREIKFYCCPVEDLRECVFKKFSQDELDNLRNLNNRKVIISLQRNKKFDFVPADGSNKEKTKRLEKILKLMPPAESKKRKRHDPPKIGGNRFSTFSENDEDIFGPSEERSETPPRQNKKDTDIFPKKRLVIPPKDEGGSPALQ